MGTPIFSKLHIDMTGRAGRITGDAAMMSGRTRRPGEAAPARSES